MRLITLIAELYEALLAMLYDAIPQGIKHDLLHDLTSNQAICSL